MPTAGLASVNRLGLAGTPARTPADTGVESFLTQRCCLAQVKSDVVQWQSHMHASIAPALVRKCCSHVLMLET